MNESVWCGPGEDPEPGAAGSPSILDKDILLELLEFSEAVGVG